MTRLLNDVLTATVAVLLVITVAVLAFFGIVHLFEMFVAGMLAGLLR